MADGAAVESRPYFVRNLGTGQCFDLPMHDKGSRETVVSQFDCRPADVDNQEWRFVPRATADGYHMYWIQNIDDALCLDPPTAFAVDPGTGLIEMDCYDQNDNQYFRLEPKGTANGLRYFWIRNVLSDLCVAAPSDTAGEQLILDSCGPCDDRRWALLTADEFQG